jgi:dTDP-4-amino-4,6-dideoxygalactose transaminase
MIPIVDLKKQYKEISLEIENAIRDVILSSSFVLGKYVEKFEQELASYIGCKYAIGVNSGTDALYIALRAYGIKEGDEVITSSLTFSATGEAIIRTGAKPVFVDIDPTTYNINVNLIEEKINKQTKVILPVHLYGKPCNLEILKDISKKYNLLLIEDNSQAIGAKYKKIKTCAWGNAGTISFYPSKNLGAYGDAGAILTNDENIYNKAKMLRQHGSYEKYEHDEIGLNSRMDSIQAAILSVKLKYLDTWNNKRRVKSDKYDEAFSKTENIVIPLHDEEYYDVYHQYTIRIKNRDKIKDELEKLGIQTGIYYPKPLHLQKAYQYLGYKEGSLPETEKAVKEILSLPIYPELKDSEQDFIINTLIDLLKREN